jgi:hypothetical protein
MKFFEEEVSGAKEKVLYDKRVRLYKVKSEEQFNEALKETRSL